MTTPNEPDTSPSGIEIIPASGATDGIRYVLDADHRPDAPTHESSRRVGSGGHDSHGLEQKVPEPLVEKSGGVADLVVDDIDAELPDDHGTIEGGQVANESKRGAY